MIIKPLGPEVSIASANTVLPFTANTGNSAVMVCRVINTGASASLHISNTTGEYANLTLANTSDIYIQKLASDTLTGANMLATPVAIRQ